MKKGFFSLLIAIFLMTGFGKNVNAQSLTFCEGVDDNGSPTNPSEVFNIPSDGGYFFFLVTLPYAINCTSISYKLYKVDDSGDETYSTTISQDDMNSTWTWFYKKVTFYETGVYKVYVRDCNNELLTSAMLQIKFQ